MFSIYIKSVALSAMLLVITTSAQNALISTYTDPPARALRDPQSVTILRAALDAVGGQDRWSSIYTVIADVSRVEGTKTFEFTWKDIRKGLYVSSLRGLSASSESNPQPLAYAHSQSETRRLLRPNRLPVHLPGLSLLLILQNNDIGIEAAALAPVSTSAEVGVTIAPARSDIGAGIVQQTWFFSSTTHLPTSVITYKDGRIPGVMIPDTTVEFADFSEQNGILTPHHMTEVSWSNHTAQLTIGHIEFKGEME